MVLQKKGSYVSTLCVPLSLIFDITIFFKPSEQQDASSHKIYLKTKIDTKKEKGKRPKPYKKEENLILKEHNYRKQSCLKLNNTSISFSIYVRNNEIP